ncbi:MAG TPA: ABC transporter ATP-binding protein [Rhizobiaceae bacterium]
MTGPVVTGPAPASASRDGPILVASRLGFRSKNGAPLVEDVSLGLAAGGRLAIIGPNGAGKTTLLRMLSGTLKPASGSVHLFGADLAAMKPAQRARQVAVVGQADQPDPRIRLWDYVGLGRVPHSGALGRADEWGIIRGALARVGLEPMRDREIGTLSGGERQRAQIARALAQQPKLLFLDEPTNHLDPRARGDLLELVAELELSVVAVLHDLALVPSFATAIAVMNGGRLVAHGTPDDVLRPSIIRSVFAVDVLRLPHPAEDRHLTVFDIPSSRT